MTKLLCILIDGLQMEALQCAHVRCLKKMMASGTTVKNLKHDGPNLPLPGLSTLFSSIPPQEHGVMDNNSGLVDSHHAISLFSLLRYHHLTASFFYSREHLQYLLPQGGLHTVVFLNSQGIKNMDSQLAEMTTSHIQREQPDVCSLALQGTDIAGTHFGYLSEPYLETVEQADQAIGILIEQLRMIGLENAYTIMITSSYGGSWTCAPADKQSDLCLPLIIAGKGIQQNTVIEQNISFIDVAPTLAHILDVSPHPNWQGRLIQDFFTQSNTLQHSVENQTYMHLFKEQQMKPAA